MRCLTILAVLCTLGAAAAWAQQPPRELQAVLAETCQPYTGPSVPGGDASTLTGKVVCGYQGWFNVEGDGADRHWVHWTKHAGPLADGNAKVDLWPDVSELGPAERFATGFLRSDGRPAEVFSSFEQETVLRHFAWMRQYGIDGALVQRFAAGVRDPGFLRHNNVVLAHCRRGANLNGRVYAVMYDLSGLGTNRIEQVIDDWRDLRLRMRIGDDPAYLHHRGKPLVAVWGVGFSDKRPYTLADCRRLVEFLKSDPQAGGCAVMLGVPAHWREQNGDAVADAALLDLLRLADVLSPWTVGRYATPADVERYAHKLLEPDLTWCRAAQIDYLPVVFPGFSWHNMYGAPSNQIPRLKGQFLWSQFLAAQRAGAQAAYVAMFDEVDEGTAIFKCINDVPRGEQSQFVTYDGLPSDYYLRLAGQGGQLIRGQLPPADRPPGAAW